VSGPVFAIGGHEDREGDRVVLRAVAAALPHPVLVVASVASRRFPEDLYDTYRAAFGDLGVQTRHLKAGDTGDDAAAALLEGAGGVFFTGGDQRRIMKLLGGTPLSAAITALWRDGGVIAGTSAGASVVSETMMSRGDSAESPRDDSVRLDAGLGILSSVVVDQHFAQRGRIGRLVAAVAQRPQLLGVGIDEDTAIDVRGDAFTVLGAGGVTVVDGRELRSHGDGDGERVLSVADARVHLLGDGDRFSLADRRPSFRAG
jgi:cyanophycinase